MALWWIATSILAIGVEAVATNFIFVFVAFAALIAAGLASLHVGLPTQLVTFATTALLLPVLLRRQIVRRFSGRGIPSRTDALIDGIAEVTHAIDPVLGTGRVVVNGQDWAARSIGVVPAGSKVRIVGADGIVLVVEVVGTP